MAHAHAHHHHHHDHAHGHAHAPTDFGRAFAIGIALNVAFVALEASAGLLYGSMALIADAGHNLSDVLALALAWIASLAARRPASGRFTYGYKSSTILAALANALMLAVAIGAILFETVQRMMNPVEPQGMAMVVVAGIGIAINGFTAMLFLKGHNDLNIRGAYLHMAADALVSLGDINVTAAFGPQHGLKGDKQDNMVESDDYVDPIYGIPVFSLYGEVRRPTGQMMSTFDVVLIDLQDLGCRIYTFITTLLYMLEEAARHGKTVWVLDRPNPAGRPVEGLTLLEGWESFVGAGPIPMRHGLTLDLLGNGHGFRAFGLHEFQPRRGGIEKVAHLDPRAMGPRKGAGLHSPHGPALDAQGKGIARPLGARRQCQARYGTD
jgi:predicted Co/Zn/Cd cation transporter (cation efflux family)